MANDIGKIELQINGQTIVLPARTELLLQHVTGKITDKDLLEKVLDEAPKWIEVREEGDRT